MTPKITRRDIARFWTKVKSRSESECWLWQAARIPDGYGNFTVSWAVPQGVMKVWIGAHRVSWFLANGEWPAKGLDVCHRCDNPPCVNPAHLFLASHKENMRGAAAKGRLGPGALVPTAYIDEIRSMLGRGTPSGVIAARFGLEEYAVKRLERRARARAIADGDLLLHRR